MKDISIYFNPLTEVEQVSDKGCLANVIERHTTENFPELKNKGVAIIYVPEYRRSNYTAETSNDDFRNFLGQLYEGVNWKCTIYDLGTIAPGKDIKDTYYALSQVVEQLVKARITPIVIGGGQDLTLSMYQAYEKLEQLINITGIDAKLDLGNVEEEPFENGWLSHILLHKPCYLFNYSNLGAQSHFIKHTEFELFEKLYFDVFRLGSLTENLKLVEPILRNTDIASFDLSAIRSSDFSGKHYLSPNGFFGQEACQLMRYAGISDKLTAMGLFNYYSEGISPASQALIAQLIWYFIDGYANRKGDFPIGSKKSYKKYRVNFDEPEQEIIFNKSDKSGRWWMEVPYPNTASSKYQRHHLVPCSYEEYQEAMKGEIPDLWWKTYQKLG